MSYLGVSQQKSEEVGSECHQGMKIPGEVLGRRGGRLMRADRLLSILLLLQVHRRITAGELARRLEVSERTIHRDMEALGTAGIPVVAERGIGGGWSLLDEYRTNLTGLNKAEIRALFLGGRHRLKTKIGLEKASDAAL